MSEAKHTPTPWEADRHNELVGANGKRIDVYGLKVGMLLGGPTPEAVANTAFIKHAVNCHNDLVEALLWMVENDETNEGDRPLPEHGGKSWNEINDYWLQGLNRARAALARARPLTSDQDTGGER